MLRDAPRHSGFAGSAVEPRRSNALLLVRNGARGDVQSPSPLVVFADLPKKLTQPPTFLPQAKVLG